MQVDLDEPEALERAATPGPWTPFLKNGVVAILKNARELIHWMGFDHDAGFKRKAAENAKLIAALRNVAPSLIEDLREARKRIAALERESRDDWNCLNRSISYFSYDGTGVREALTAKRDEIYAARLLQPAKETL